jgi:hypothetical protein
MSWTTVLHDEAEQELTKLPGNEAVAVVHVIEKLKVAGPTLSFPHSSNVQGADKLRELRPRAGNSPWRCFYRRIGAVFVIAAIGPEAANDPRGFKRAIKAAVRRLSELEED